MLSQDCDRVIQVPIPNNFVFGLIETEEDQFWVQLQHYFYNETLHCTTPE